MDSKFVKGLDALLEGDGIEVVPVGPRKPNLNAYAERWVQSIRQECLDHFVIFGEAHLRYLVHEYVSHYNQERPHQSQDNRPLNDARVPPVESSTTAEIVCQERLGGLLKHYYRRAS